MSEKETKKSLLETLGESQVWKSIFRSGVPKSRRQRMLFWVMFSFTCIRHAYQGMR